MANRKNAPFFFRNGINSVKTLQNLFKKSAEPIKKSFAISLFEQEICKESVSKLSIEKSVSTLDPEQIKELSELRKIPRNEQIHLERKVLTSLFGKRDMEITNSFPFLINYLHQFLSSTLDKSPFLPCIQRAFHHAVDEKKKFQTFIKENQAPELAERRSALLLKKAANLQASIKKLSKKQPFIYFGELSSEIIEKNSMLDSFLKNQLPEEIYGLVQSDSSDLAEKVKSYVLENFSEHGLAENEIFRATTKIENSLKHTLNSASGVLKNVLPEKWYQSLANNLKEDLRELVVGARSKEGTLRTAERFWDGMIEQGIQKAIEETLENSLKALALQGKEIVKESLGGIFTDVAEKLPKPVLDCLSTSGFQLNSSESFWIEVEKQKNGNYCLRFYSNDLSGEIHEEIEGKKADATFL